MKPLPSASNPRPLFDMGDVAWLEDNEGDLRRLVQPDTLEGWAIQSAWLTIAQVFEDHPLVASIGVLLTRKDDQTPELATPMSLIQGPEAGSHKAEESVREARKHLEEFFQGLQQRYGSWVVDEVDGLGVGRDSLEVGARDVLGAKWLVEREHFRLDNALEPGHEQAKASGPRSGVRF